MVNYPTSLDDDDSLWLVVNNVTDVLAKHHNDLKDAVIALETKLGITGSDYTFDANALMTGTGTDDKRLRLCYLTAIPGSADNGSIWMEADGLHLYRNSAEAIVAVWDQANTSISGYRSIGGRGLINLAADDGSHGWTWDSGNAWLECATISTHTFPIQLQNGCTVNNFVGYGQQTSTAVFTVSLIRQSKETGVVSTMATVTLGSSMGEDNDPSVSYAIVNNEDFNYHLSFDIATTSAECRFRGVEIRYGVVTPQP